MKRNLVRLTVGLAVACAALIVMESQANAGLFGRGSCGSWGGRGHHRGCQNWCQSSCDSGCQEAAPCEEATSDCGCATSCDSGCGCGHRGLFRRHRNCGCNGGGGCGGGCGCGGAVEMTEPAKPAETTTPTQAPSTAPEASPPTT